MDSVFCEISQDQKGYTGSLTSLPSSSMHVPFRLHDARVFYRLIYIR